MMGDEVGQRVPWQRQKYFDQCYNLCVGTTEAELTGDALDGKCVEEIKDSFCDDACTQIVLNYDGNSLFRGVALTGKQIHGVYTAANYAAEKIKAECQESPQPVPEDATEESPQPDSDFQKIILALAQITSGLEAVQQTIQDVTSDQTPVEEDDGVDWGWMGLGVGIVVFAAPAVYFSVQAAAGVLAGFLATSSS